MSTQKNSTLTLDNIVANRQMLEDLAAHNLISPEAKQYGLQLLYPSQKWMLWISRLLLVLGVTLILAGIIYLFAFNWAKITPLVKLVSIQIALLICLTTAYLYRYKPFIYKIFLLSAAILVGVFYLVFGQIYQIGANSYSLFMWWSLLILPWVIISDFAALWISWLVITNIFLICYWHQAIPFDPSSKMLIVSLLLIFNCLFLSLREYLLKTCAWLQGKWIRITLVIVLLVYAFIPSIMFIHKPSTATYSIILGTCLALIMHVVFYTIYRFKLFDLPILTFTSLSFCLILEAVIIKALAQLVSPFDAIFYLFAGILTLIIFTMVITHLRKLAKEVGKQHV